MRAAADAAGISPRLAGLCAFQVTQRIQGATIESVGGGADRCD